VIRIRAFDPSLALPAARLIRRTYSRFNAGHSPAAAVRRYLDQHYPLGDPAGLQRTFAAAPLCLVAIDGRSVVGIIRGKGNQVVSLFVDGRLHRRGIGRRLLGRFEAAARRAGHSAIVLRAAPHAVAFYQAMGYSRTTGARRYHGLSVQPMRRVLERSRRRGTR